MLKNLIVLPDGTEIMSGAGTINAIQSATYTSCVNSGTELTLGSVCCNALEAKIFTPNGELNISAGKEVTYYKVDDSGERHKMGVFIAEKPAKSSAHTYKLTAYDRISWLDRDLTDWLASLSDWPYSLLTFAQMVCDACGLTLITESIPNGDFLVQGFTAEVTGRDLMRWVGEACGRFCRANANGEAELVWYKTVDCEIDLNGEYYIKQNGLSYDDYQIKSIDGVNLHLLDGETSMVWPDSGTITNAYVITGNYLLVGENNDDLTLALKNLYDILSEVQYTPCKVTIPANLDINAGDIVRVTDRNGNQITSYVMIKTQSGQRDTLECTGSISRNSAIAVNAKSSSDYAKLLKDEKNAREAALRRLAQALKDSSGLYMTEVAQEDGSIIYYAHDRSTLETSVIVWKYTAEAIGISTDGGETYPYGFVVDGELITRILQTEGVNADWINAGTLVVKDADENVIFSVNMDTHEVLMDADHIMIGDGKTLSQMVEESKSLHVILSNEYQGIPADSSGNIATFPACATTIQILYGQTDITSKCSISATTSTGVTGSLNGTTYTVTALAADTGYVDIKATYLTMTATKRFTISKVKGGSNVKMLNTDLSLTQEMLAEFGAIGHNRNWTVMTSTDGLKSGDSVIIQGYNSSKDNSEAFIMATVNEVLSTNRINATSAGLLDKGDSGRVYSLEPSVTVIKRGQDSIPVPDAITFSAFYRDGNSASRTAYAGRFVIETSTDGNTWSKVYTSAADETSCKYELYTALEDGNGNYIEDGNGNVLVAWYDESSVMMRATLYAAGGTTSSLDMQTVPVVIDVAALTHLQIFNLLTNNGTWQGLFYENGHLYLNGEYMKFIGANIGGWNIGEKAIYKNVVDPTDPNIVYCLYFQPPSFALDDPERTWVLSCQISRDGGKTSTPKFFICADGKIQMYSDNRKYMFEIAPPDDNNLDGSAVFTIWEISEDGTALVSKKTRLRSNGKFNLRQLLINDPIEFPHVVGDGQYLQLSPVKGEAWGAVIEALNGGQWFYPAASGTMYLGSEEHKWAQIWSTNSAIATSDRNEKNSIAALDADKWLSFLMGLQIVSYKLNDGTSGRLHHGMVAQDVEMLLKELEIDSQDFAGFIRWHRTRREERYREVTDDLGQKRQQRYFEEIPIYDENGEPVYGYGLRYEEFLPMTIKAVQGLYMENLAIRTELADLKQKVANLTN